MKNKATYLLLLMALASCDASVSPLESNILGEWHLDSVEVVINDKALKISPENALQVIGKEEYKFYADSMFQKLDFSGQVKWGNWSYDSYWTNLNLVYQNTGRHDVWYLDSLTSDFMKLGTRRIDAKTGITDELQTETVNRAFLLLLNYKGPQKPSNLEYVEINYFLSKTNEDI